MSGFQTEWDYYLQAFRLHQGLSAGGNAETRRLLNSAIGAASANGRVMPRAYGLMSFTILNGWLSDWIDQPTAGGMLDAAIADLDALGKGNWEIAAAADDLRDLKSGSPSLDAMVKGLITAYA